MKNSLSWVIGGPQGSGVDSALISSLEHARKVDCIYSERESIILISRVSIAISL